MAEPGRWPSPAPQILQPRPFILQEKFKQINLKGCAFRAWWEWGCSRTRSIGSMSIAAWPCASKVAQKKKLQVVGLDAQSARDIGGERGGAEPTLTSRDGRK